MKLEGNVYDCTFFPDGSLSVNFKLKGALPAVVKELVSMVVDTNPVEIEIGIRKKSNKKKEV